MNMKKTRQLGRACVMMTVAALLIGMWAISVCAVSGGMSLGDMVAATVASGGEPAAGVGDAIEFTMLKGDFFGGGTLSKFDAFGSAMVGQDSDHNFIRNWDFRASTGVDTVIRVTARQNMRLEIAQGYDVTQWAIGSAFYYVTENSDGVRVTAKEIPVAANMAKESFGMQHHLAAGDSLYVIYKSHTTEPGGYVNANFAPWFQVETDAYDAGQRAVYAGETEDPADTREEVLSGDIVSETVAAQGGVVSKGNADFQFLMGDFFGGGTLSPFTVFAGNGDYSYTDTVGDPNGENAAWRWQWRATAKNNTILKITAKENMMFLVEQRDEIADEQWATNSAYTYVLENAEGERCLCREMMVKATMEKDYVRTEIHLAEGDTLYIVYTVPSGDEGVVTSVYSPWFVMDPASYDAEKRAEYSFGTGDSDDASETDYLEHPYMVSRQVAANGGAVSATLVDYQYLYGDFSAGTLKPFTVFAGAGNGSDDDDVIGDPNGANAVWRWQWRCGSGETVLKLTAKENIKLDLTAMDVSESQWALGSSYRVIAENADGQRAAVKTVAVTGTVNTADYAVTVHLAKGDSLYIVYQGNGQYADESPATSHYMPVFTMTTAGYDAASRPVFTDSVPTTGDSGSLAAAAAVLAVSLLFCGVLLLGKKKRI